MASLPPLRARAVTKIFSDWHSIDDGVRRILQLLEETVGGGDGASSRFDFWRASAGYEIKSLVWGSEILIRDTEAQIQFCLRLCLCSGSYTHMTLPTINSE